MQLYHADAIYVPMTIYERYIYKDHLMNRTEQGRPERASRRLLAAKCCQSRGMPNGYAVRDVDTFEEAAKRARCSASAKSRDPRAPRDVVLPRLVLEQLPGQPTTRLHAFCDITVPAAHRTLPPQAVSAMVSPT